MKIWNFYYSGILTGQIKEDGGLMCKTLIPETAEYSQWVPLTEDNPLSRLCRRDILDLMKILPSCQNAVKSTPATFTLDNGDRYDLRRGTSYIQRLVKFPKDLLLKDGEVFAVMMPGRDDTAILVKDGMESETILPLWDGICREAIKPVHVYGTFFVTTRDGESLATDVYLPGEPTKPLPCVLVRTPYGKGVNAQNYYRFVQRGYAVVIQDTRGREDSTGEWLPNYYEVEDGDDTLNWIANQDWSDGQVSMTGGSYLGYVQWAAAASGNPHLKAMLSSVCAGSAFVDVPRRGGCFNSGMLAWAFAMTEQRMRPDLMVRDDWEEVLNIRPIKDIPKIALGHEVPFLTKWLSHTDYDEMWKRSSWKDRSQGTVVPALIMSGWFDDNGMGTTEALELVSHYPPGNCKVVLGPWMHSGNANYDLHGVYLGEDALRYDMDLLCFQWLDHFLRGVDNGIEQTAPVEYYTVGEGRWKTAAAWPIPEAVPTCCYLDGDRDHIASGDGGRLSFDKPKQDGQDGYDYDPQHPANHLIDMSENEIEVPENYTQEEKRPDVLCYSTPPLEKPVTVTGDLLVTLYVSSDCPDTDFMVRLTDVDENGTSIKLADGVLSARYRDGFDKPKFMEEGKVYEIPISTTKISNTFQTGHKIRITITSSAKNFIFPNSNTEKGFDSEVNRIAHNVIHRGGVYASCVVLPIVP